MRAGGGKPKGNAWELEVCKLMSRWISHGLRSDLFVRNVASGGAFTMAARSGRDPGTPGDVMAGAPEAHAFLQSWMVEAKHWKSLELDAALWRQRGSFIGVVDKAEEQARDAGRSYMVVAKQNHRPAICLVPHAVGIERAEVVGINYHVLWSCRTVAFLFSDLLTTEPAVWMA